MDCGVSPLSPSLSETNCAGEVRGEEDTKNSEIQQLSALADKELSLSERQLRKGIYSSNDMRLGGWDEQPG